MNESQEAWETLCKQASKEQDPERLMNLVRRILELLDGNGGTSTPDQHVQPGESSNDRIAG